MLACDQKFWNENWKKLDNGKPKVLSSEKVWFGKVASSIITNVYAYMFMH